MDARILSAFAAPALLAGCMTMQPGEDRSGPLTLSVTFLDEPDGLDFTEPSAFSSDPIEYEVRVEVLGYDRSVVDSFDGPLAVKSTPGVLLSPEAGVVEARAGVWTGTIEVVRAYGEVRLWFADEGTPAQPGSFATGVSPAVHIDRPTITDLQTSDSTTESYFEHQYVPLKGWDGTPTQRDLVVTTVSNDGFYVTDRTSPPGSYNSLFVFSFSRPDGVQVGDRIAELSGIVSEFLGYTELGFPTWTVASSGNVVDDPAVLDPTMVCNDDAMERWEAAVVRLEGLRSDFQSGNDCADYAEFAQWPAVLEGFECGGEPARVSVVNANTVPSFRFPDCSLSNPPTEEHDVSVEYLVGILRHLEFADPPWIIDVRSCLDFPPEHRPADCEQLLLRPPSGPRIAPAAYYRDLVTCEGVPYHLD